MEEYLRHHCVTSDVAEAADCASTWQTSSRAECVLVQENREAYGASRVILSAMLDLVVQSSKTTNVLLLTLDLPEVAQRGDLSAKFTVIDYSVDAANFQPSTSSESQLLTRILQDIERVAAKAASKRTRASRPMVVVLDSLNALLQQSSLQQVLQFLRQLRKHVVVGSVITRLNAGAESLESTRALAAQATAIVLVETRLSLRSYPLLSRERRREIPKEMHGFVLLVRQKKNGRSSESLEYFRVLSNQVHFVATTDIKRHHVPADAASKSKHVISIAGPTSSQIDAEPTSILERRNVPLPVRQDEVSFNMSISAAEQQAKNQVELPFRHQRSGQSPSNSCSTSVGNNTLFFIDDDDPDWDDDDLDDDLDI